jgi:hypothetical protein
MLRIWLLLAVFRLRTLKVTRTETLPVLAATTGRLLLVTRLMAILILVPISRGTFSWGTPTNIVLKA